jgi:hypothetical protein
MSASTIDDENNNPTKKEDEIETKSHYDIYKEYGQKLPLDIKLLRLWDDAEHETQQKVNKLLQMGVSDTIEIALTLYIFHKMWMKIGFASLNKAIELKKLKPDDLKTADQCVLEMYRYFMDMTNDEDRINDLVAKSNMPEGLKRIILERHKHPNVSVSMADLSDIIDEPTKELAGKMMDKMFAGDPSYEEFKKRRGFTLKK